MNCTACGGPLKPSPTNDSLVCEYCHSVYFPDKNEDGVALAGEDRNQSCPVCSIPLMVAVLEKAEIRYCTRCRGMLIPMASLASVVDSLQERAPGKVDTPPVDPAELRRRLTCPHCHKPMIVDYYPAASNVVYGSCEACLLDWIDHGKLARIVEGARQIQQEETQFTQESAELDPQY